MQRGSFFVKEHILANMSFLSYAHVSRCARHALEPTDHRLLYADDMICAVSPHSVVAIRSAWFNVPWFFFFGGNNNSGLDEEDLLLGLVSRSLLRRYQTCNEAQGRLFEHDCKNLPFSIKLCVYNCLYSIPTLTGEHLHLRITHKRHVCKYVFLHKKLSSLHGLSSLSFCRWGPVTPCIYIYTGFKLQSFLKKGCFLICFVHVVLLKSLEMMWKNLQQ